MASNRRKIKSILGIICVAVMFFVFTFSNQNAVRSAAEETTNTSDTTDTADTNTADSTDDTENAVTASGTTDESTWITIDDYEVVAESDSYIMYYYEPRLSIILENKNTGAIMESTLSDEKNDGTSNKTWAAYMQSGIVIAAIRGTVNTYQVDMTTNHTTKTTKLDNGVSAELYFNEWGFGLTVNITLEDNELVVNIPDDSIKEDMTDSSLYISSISVFPFLGYTYMDEQDGYMFIPDGNGALIYLDDKEGRYSTGFSQMIYGSDAGFSSTQVISYLWERFDAVTDPNKVLAPVFGMAHTEDELAYLAIVEEGETRAYIEAHPNGAIVNYNRCFARFMLRDIFSQPLSSSENASTVTTVEPNRTHDERQVRYILLEGDDADYSGMAVTYRNYLLENGLVEVKDNDYSTRVDFLGTDREDFMIGTTAVTLTTVDNIAEMYEELQSGGVTSLMTVYKGWQKGGLYEVPITKYKADSHIGGTSSLTDLIADSAESNYNIYLYNDALRSNASTNSSTSNVIRRISKRTFVEENDKQVYDEFYYLIPTRTSSLINKFTNSYTDEGVSNLAIGGISDTLFSYYYKQKYYSRSDVADTYSSTIASVDESTSLILEQPFSYLWNNTEAFLDMPLGSSDYMYIDEEVPFLSMVLKGILPMYSDYVNFEANKTEFFLQLVESGVYPSFYITYENSSSLIYTNSSDLYSTEYSTYKDTIIEYDSELRELAEVTGDAYIINHEKLENNVTKVTYNNDVVIYVNYSESDAVVDGITVPALSYKVGEA